MKRIVFGILGALVGLFLCNLLFWGVGQLAVLMDIRLYNGEESSSRNFLIYLLCIGVSFCLGFWAGYKRVSNGN